MYRNQLVTILLSKRGASSHRCDAEALVVRRVVMISDYYTDVDESKQGRTTGVTADSSHSSAKVGGNEPRHQVQCPGWPGSCRIDLGL